MRTVMQVEFNPPVDKEFIETRFDCFFIRYPMQKPKLARLTFMAHKKGFKYRILVQTELGYARLTELVFKKAFWNKGFAIDNYKIAEAKFQEIVNWNLKFRNL